MSPSGAEILRQITSRIDEVDPSEVHEQLGNGTVLVDVREPEEWAAGHIPGAKHVPKSYLESRIGAQCPTARLTSCSTAPRATARHGRPARSWTTSATSASSR